MTRFQRLVVLLDEALTRYIRKTVPTAYHGRPASSDNTVRVLHSVTCWTCCPCCPGGCTDTHMDACGKHQVPA